MNMPKISKLKYLHHCIGEAKVKMEEREMRVDINIFDLLVGCQVIDIPISLGKKTKIYIIVKDVTVDKIHHYALWHSNRYTTEIGLIGQNFNVTAPVNAPRKRI